jgi:hypothetical protein
VSKVRSTFDESKFMRHGDGLWLIHSAANVDFVSTPVSPAMVAAEPQTNSCHGAASRGQGNEEAKNGEQDGIAVWSGAAHVLKLISPVEIDTSGGS